MADDLNSDRIGPFEGAPSGHELVWAFDGPPVDALNDITGLEPMSMLSVKNSRQHEAAKSILHNHGNHAHLLDKPTRAARKGSFVVLTRDDEVIGIVLGFDQGHPSAGPRIGRGPPTRRDEHNRSTDEGKNGNSAHTGSVA